MGPRGAKIPTHGRGGHHHGLYTGHRASSVLQAAVSSLPRVMATSRPAALVFRPPSAPSKFVVKTIAKPADPIVKPKVKSTNQQTSSGTKPVSRASTAKTTTRTVESKAWSPKPKQTSASSSVSLATDYGHAKCKDAVWALAKTIPGEDPAKVRQDPYGNKIWYDRYGKGLGIPGSWELDHIKPRAKGGSDHLRNLQALSSIVNNEKSDSLVKRSRHNQS